MRDSDRLGRHLGGLGGGVDVVWSRNIVVHAFRGNPKEQRRGGTGETLRMSMIPSLHW